LPKPLPTAFYPTISTSPFARAPKKSKKPIGVNRFVYSQRIDSNLTPPSLAFKNLFIAYTRAFNRATGRTGTLFERPFHRKPVDSQAYFLTLINYIHQNPQKHGLIADFRDWKWSSYGAYCSDRPSNIRREQVIAWYGGQRSFFEAHDKDLTNLQDLSNLWEP
jgi:hypothetical protein